MTDETREHARAEINQYLDELPPPAAKAMADLVRIVATGGDTYEVHRAADRALALASFGKRP